MAHFPTSLSYEQTSGVLRHTVSVQDDKVQKHVWKQCLEKKFSAPPARPRSCSRSKETEVHSAVKADESLTKRAIPKVEVLYVVLGCSETSVRSTRRRRGARPQERASSITAWYVLYVGRAADKVAPDGSVARTILIGTEAKEVYGTSFQSISTSFVLSRDRGFMEAMSTASDISSIGTVRCCLLLWWRFG